MKIQKLLTKEIQVCIKISREKSQNVTWEREIRKINQKLKYKQFSKKKRNRENTSSLIINKIIEKITRKQMFFLQQNKIKLKK